MEAARPLLHEHLCEMLGDESIWRLQYDTYEREVRRYGGDAGIEASEQVFWADSEAVVDLLSELHGDEGASARWRLALLGVDTLLDDLGFDLAGKRQIASVGRAHFAAEFGVDGAAGAKQFAARYRDERRSLEELFAVREDPRHQLSHGTAVLARRTERIGHWVRALRGAVGHDEISWSGLARSFVHMHVNRIMRADQRAHELVIYDFLERRYRSLAARQMEAVSRDSEVGHGLATP